MAAHIENERRTLPRNAVWIAFCGPLLLVVLAGCSTRTTSYDIVQRSFRYDSSSLTKDYAAEYHYIRARRKQLATDEATTFELNDDCYYQYSCAWCTGRGQWMKILPGNVDTCASSSAADCSWCQDETRSLRERGADGAWERGDRDLTGLALSGGGIRSASFSLGVIQALDALHALPRIDYMSSVSGGSYMAGWVQAHLGANQHGAYRDALYYEVAAVDFHDLLRNQDDNVEQLRTHTQFINKGGFWEGPTLILEYLWRWPLNLVFDVILHIKGDYNYIHPVTVYQDRIETTYFRGDPPPNVSAPPKRAARLAEANDATFPTPYLIINGNLVNHGRARAMNGNAQDNFNFEFTRDFAGSDGLGYIPSEAFDRDVESVETDENGVPTTLTVKGSDLDGSAFRISQAVSASGAAFDPDGAVVALDDKWVRTPAAQIGGLLNLNLGYETWNFARGYNGPFWTPVDYVRMQTYQRVLEPGTDARWIKITDGGHYENLGVASLARRGVACIISVDATADPQWRFDDLKALQRRLVDYGLTLHLDPALLDVARRTGHAKLQVTRTLVDGTSEPVSTILYLKPNADPAELRNDRSTHGEAPDHMAMTYVRDGVEHLKGTSTVDAIQKIKWYQHTKAEATFPHTSTFMQWYDWETFEAYRLLGFQMAKTYLPHGADLPKCEFNDHGEP